MILTGYPSLNTAIEALKLGARDYLIKPCGRKELLQKVETCLKRNDEISEISDFTTQTMTKFQEAGLTHREIEVCILVQNGVNNKEIASRFCISLHTVKNHLKKIHSKLGTHNRTELAVLLNQQK